MWYNVEEEIQGPRKTEILERIHHVLFLCPKVVQKMLGKEISATAPAALLHGPGVPVIRLQLKRALPVYFSRRGQIPAPQRPYVGTYLPMGRGQEFHPG